MFTKFVSWIKSWFQSTNPSDRLDFYQPVQRVIYSYWNGKEQVKTDPMVIYRKIMEVGPELSIDIKVSRSQSKDANKAYLMMLQKIRGVFSVKSFEEGGLTETETIKLMDHFMEYCEDLKKNSRPSVISAVVTSVSSNSSSEENQTTKNSLDSGSTENVPCTELPMGSPTVSV